MSCVQDTPIRIMGDEVRDIIAEVARDYGIAPSDITGPYRPKRITCARVEAIGRIKDAFPSISLHRLGKIFNRHHTSILYSLYKYGRATPRPGSLINQKVDTWRQGVEQCDPRQYVTRRERLALAKQAEDQPPQFLKHGILSWNRNGVWEVQQ